MVLLKDGNTGKYVKFCTLIGNMGSEERTKADDKFADTLVVYDEPSATPGSSGPPAA